MGIALEHLVYGKLVQSPGGPIVPGLDYRVTGASAGYPGDLVARSHPHRIGINTSDLFNWDRYPWNAAGGGFIVQPTFSKQGPMVIVGRIRGRSEKGENQPGRVHVQAHYAVTPAEFWRPAAIALLPSLLRAEPMTAEDRALPPLILVNGDLQAWLDQPLAAGWIDTVADLLAAVMSGNAFSIQDWHASIDEFLQLCARCACAVPTALAWRLSIGAGLGEMKGDVVLGLGQIAPSTGIRKVGGSLKRDNARDTKTGEVYVQWLRLLTENAPSLAEVRRRIDAALPNFAHPLTDEPGDWLAMAERISATVGKSVRRVAVRAWLDDGVGPRPSLQSVDPEPETLALILRVLEPRGLEFLPECLTPSWRVAWERIAEGDDAVAPKARSIARLAGFSDVAMLEDIARCAHLDFPKVLHGKLASNLDHAVADERADGNWFRLLDRPDGHADWLESWLSTADGLLFWLAVDCLDRAGDARLIEALRQTKRAGNLISAFDTLRRSEADQECHAAARTLVASAQNRNRAYSLDRLAAALRETGGTIAIFALYEVRLQSNDYVPAQMLADIRKNDDRYRHMLADDLIEKLEATPHRCTPAMVHLLVGKTARKRLQGRLLGVVARQLGRPYAQFVLGVPSFGGESDAAARDFAFSALLQDGSLAERLVFEDYEDSRGRLRQLLFDWLNQPDARSAESPTARFLARFCAGQSCAVPDEPWTPSQGERVARLLELIIHHGLKISTDEAVDLIAPAGSIAQLENKIRIGPRYFFFALRDRKQFEMLASSRMQGADAADSLFELLRKRDYDRRSRWRLLFQSWHTLKSVNEFQSASGTRDSVGRRIFSKLGWKQHGDIVPEEDENELARELGAEWRIYLAALNVRLPQKLLQFEISTNELRSYHLSVGALAQLLTYRIPRLNDAVCDILPERILQYPPAARQIAAELGIMEPTNDAPLEQDLSSLVDTVMQALGKLPERDLEWVKNQFALAFDDARSGRWGA